MVRGVFNFFTTLDSIYLDFKDAADCIKHVLYMDSNYLNKSNRNRNKQNHILDSMAESPQNFALFFFENL